MNRSSRIGATVLAAVSISGCLLPEKFETSIVVKPDASYTYKYDGTAVHFLAAMAIKEQGKLAPKDEAAIDADAKKSAKSPGVKKLNYTGNGRYDISILEELMPGQKVKTLQIFNFTKAKDGVYSIVPPGMTAKDLDQLKALDIKVSGKAEVMLPSNAKVVSHNATGTPGMFSKTYSWKIGSIAEQPSIRFTLAN